MNKLWRIFRRLRHPYLIKRAIFIRLYKQKHEKRTRSNDYKKHDLPMVQGIQKLTDVQLDSIKNIRRELAAKTALHKRFDWARRALESKTCGLNENECSLLYVLCRILRPKIAIETGVANGFSSFFILQAIEDNNIGKLFSIDLHCREGITVPVEKSLGWVIPEELRHRWDLILGESTRKLYFILKQAGSVDIFFSDSTHIYKTMMKEFQMVWPYLRTGGILLADDIELNNAFLDFCDSVIGSPVVFFGKIGAIVK